MRKMTVGKKFTWIFITIIATALIVSFFVFSTIWNQRRSASVINLAGRERMLIQKYTKEINAELIPAQLRNSTIKAAKITTLQIVTDRTHYTKNVVGKLIKEAPEVHPNQHYNSIVGGIPLPATFVKEVSDIINNKGVYSYDLLSKWNINKEKGLKTDFEKEAFDYLYTKKGDEFFRFEEYKGLYALRYATPDIASAPVCVSCHNNHEESPKRDFQQGEVMGILVVNIPIGQANEEIAAFLDTRKERQIGSDTFLKTAEVFEKTLHALIHGGKAPLDLEMAKFTFLRPTTDPAILGKLKEVEQQWVKTKENTKKVFEAEVNSAEYISCYNNVAQAAGAVIHTTNEAVDMYQAHTNKKNTLLLWIQGAATGVVCLVIALSWLGIVQPLIKVLKGLIDKMSNSASQVSSASEQISASSQSLSGSTSQQAASIEETSSTMEEISAMTRQNAEHATEASKLAVACNVTVENGNKSVVETVESGNSSVVGTVENGNRSVVEMSNAMKDISESSEKIAGIIKIIEGIAFQTNLLALNAAVEAARAGDHGRGFAVVAEEVRSLAQRSSSAAKDITSLIADCMKKSERGMELVNKTKEVFASTAMTVKEVFAGTAAKVKEVFSSSMVQVKKVSDLVNEIAAASEEQTHGIQQISKAIQQMEQVVQQNAANAEETASASEELTAQAQGLNDLVDGIAAEVGMKNANGVGDGVDRHDTFKKKGGEPMKRGGVASSRYPGARPVQTKTIKDAGKTGNATGNGNGNGNGNKTADVTADGLGIHLEPEFKNA